MLWSIKHDPCRQAFNPAAACTRLPESPGICTRPGHHHHDIGTVITAACIADCKVLFVLA